MKQGRDGKKTLHANNTNNSKAYQNRELTTTVPTMQLTLVIALLRTSVAVYSM